MMQESNAAPAGDAKPWWFRWLQKGACVIAGLLCVILGLFACITLKSVCLAAGILQAILGVLIFLLEAPCCCAYLDFIDAIAKFSDGRPAYQKAILYCLLPIAPVAICPEPSTVAGCLFVFLCGLSFAFIALGPKASREETLQAARSDNLQTKSSSRLVDNAQPMSSTAPPSSNVV
ncbi:calcium channel flower-like [Watersipora subatra]|uniref:calcium channel flower-like n=1 Tax=Watersipora subatra TaxID=2589382 RepID=UPI00355ACF83